jgi:hypothetical protein
VVTESICGFNHFGRKRLRDPYRQLFLISIKRDTILSDQNH